MAEARITVEHAADPDAVARSLRNWLDGEDSLRGRVTLDEVPIREGEMGTVSEVLMVALGSGGAGAVLATSLATWITQLRSDVSVRIQRGDTSVELDAARVKDSHEILEQLISLLGPQEKDVPPSRE